MLDVHKISNNDIIKNILVDKNNRSTSSLNLIDPFNRNNVTTPHFVLVYSKQFDLTIKVLIHSMPNSLNL